MTDKVKVEKRTLRFKATIAGYSIDCVLAGSDEEIFRGLRHQIKKHLNFAEKLAFNLTGDEQLMKELADEWNKENPGRTVRCPANPTELINDCIDVGIASADTDSGAGCQAKSFANPEATVTTAAGRPLIDQVLLENLWAINPRFYAILGKVINTHISKSHDYALSGSPFGNFEEVAQATGHSVEKVMEVMIAIKTARVHALTAEGKIPNNESLQDTYLDRAVYSMLQAAYTMESVIDPNKPYWYNHPTGKDYCPRPETVDPRLCINSSFRDITGDMFSMNDVVTGMDGTVYEILGYLNRLANVVVLEVATPGKLRPGVISQVSGNLLRRTGSFALHRLPRAWPNDGWTQCDYCAVPIQHPSSNDRPDGCNMPHYGECLRSVWAPPKVREWPK